MLHRQSALEAVYTSVNNGDQLTLCELTGMKLVQLSAWPNTLAEVGERAAHLAGVDQLPEPGRAVLGQSAMLMRSQPLGWWIAGGDETLATSAQEIDPQIGTALDISHSRVVVRVEGLIARELMSRLITIDLRDSAFPEGCFAGCMSHHSPIHVHHRAGGYDLYLPRSFARGLWEFILETSEQWQYSVVDPVDYTLHLR